jgi:hypothetical protein
VSDIKPRVVDGVGWCSRNCPHAGGVGYGDYVSCDVAEERDCKLVQPWTEVCPLWAARMAAWAEEAREWISSEMYDPHQGGGYKLLCTYPGGNDQTQDGNGGE